MLEVVACLAMELPGGTDVSALREERRRLLASVRPLDPTRIVRGQVRGYLDDKDVAKGSTTETFAALSLTIDSERWQGVPFFLRVGKSLPVTATEAIVRWKQPRQAVLEDHAPPAPNHVRFRLGPDAVVALGANVKKEGKAFSGEPRELELHRAGADEMKPYERLLGDAIDGDMALIVDPILGDATPVHPYEPGSWGPSEASRVAPDGGWYDPR
jgi:glucose-6-phosphate 1-dehydrogenase